MTGQPIASAAPPRRSLIVLLAILAAAPAAAAADGDVPPPAHHHEDAPPAEVWTCSMHPQIRLPQPGQCPICGMPLVLATRGGETASAPAGTLTLDDHAVRMAQVATAVVERKPVVRRLRTVGVIDYNEAGQAAIPARVGGYLERLFINQTGVHVRPGDHLAEIFSPDLIVAQQELLVAKDRPEGRALATAARAKLRRFGVSDDQVAALEKTGAVQERLTLTSPIDGIVVEKMVVAQAPVEMGMILYRVANLDSVWVQLSVHEQDLQLIRPGQAVTIRTDAAQEQALDGRVVFIDPIVDPMTRTARARVVVANPSGSLKPNLYVTADIAIPLRADGTPGPTGVEGKWTCPMHPDVLADAAGACPRCGMQLERIPQEEQPSSAQPPLVVPASAVLDLGTRAVVWVEDAPGTYRLAVVRVRPASDDRMLVVDGVKEGDHVVARGGFLIDSEAQIRGLPSLLKPEGGGGTTGHQHGGAGGGATPAAGSPTTDHQH